jgi:hypothetical protein
MNRFLWLLFVLWLPATILGQENLSIELTTSYAIPSEQVFKDVYGGGVVFGAELGFDLHKRISGRAGIGYFQRTGALTITGDETRLHIVPLELGTRYRFSASKTVPYAGGGLSINFYKESNSIGDVSGSSLGIVGEAGLLRQITRTWWVDFSLRYNVNKAEGVNLGGARVGIGIRYQKEPSS